MAIVANGDFEKLKVDYSISCKFGEEISKKKARLNNLKMTNGLVSLDSATLQNTNASLSLNSNLNTTTTSTTKVNSVNSLNDNQTSTTTCAQSSESSSSSLKISVNNANKTQDLNVSIANNNNINNTIDTKTPSPSSTILTENNAIRLANNKQKISLQSNLPIINNNLTTSPPLSSSTSNKFSIANILNEDCEPLDANYRRNQTINLPPNANSLLSATPNSMMLNQNDLAALSSLNLIAWQASYAAQQAQAGNYLKLIFNNSKFLIFNLHFFLLINYPSISTIAYE